MISNLTPSAEAFLANTSRTQRQIAQASQQASSGRRVSTASDAPEDIGAIMRIGTSTTQNTQVLSNLGLEKIQADAADNAISAAAKLLDRARTLGAQGANFTLDATGRQDLAGEVQALQEQMVAISATSVQGGYIFSGDRQNQPSYSLDLTAASGVARLATSVSTRVAQDPAGGTFAVSKGAQDIFDLRNPDDTAAAGNVFGALNSLRTSLLNNDTAGIDTAIASVQSAGDHLGSSQAFYGTVQNRIQDAVNFGQGYDVQLKTEMGQKVDADLTAAALELSQGNTQLQAAFQMQAKMPHTSLFDFMG